MLKCDTTCFLVLQSDIFIIFWQNCVSKLDSEISCYIRSGVKVNIFQIANIDPFLRQYN